MALVPTSAISAAFVPVWNATATVLRKRCSVKPSSVPGRREAHAGLNGVRYLATRFSAKEAFSKAIGLGMRMPMTWRLCEIAKLPQDHANAGKPCIVLHGGLKDWFDAQGLTAHVSVTDETDYAASFCVVEKIGI